MYTTHSSPSSAATVAAGHPVLPGAGFGDDALFAHALRQQRLAQGIVDLMRPGMRQVFALEVNLRAAQLRAQTRGVRQGRGPPHVGAQQAFNSAGKPHQPALGYAASSSPRAGINVSGTNCPP